MKTFLKAVLVTLSLLVLCCVIYPLIMLGIAQLTPNHGHGFIIKDKNNNVYYENIAQAFNSDKYFHSRPSAVNYDAAGSGGSNKGPNDPEYLKTVKYRVDSLKKDDEKIPVDLVTASGSGLDPHISVEGAKFQAERIAKARNMDIDKIYKLIDSLTENNHITPPKINVLKINIALDKQ